MEEQAGNQKKVTVPIVEAEARLESPISLLRLTRETAWSHHEKWNGKGTNFDPDIVDAFMEVSGEFNDIALMYGDPEGASA